MQVQIVTRKAEDTRESLTCMQYDDTFIEVQGLGTSEYKVRVAPAGEASPEYAPMETLAEIFRVEPTPEWFDSKQFGTALVWAEPLTIAHVVMNCLTNA